jgi:hypothetical protein
MPVLVLTVSEDFHKLLENGGLAPVTALGELGRVVIVAVDIAVMFVVTVLGAKHCRTYGASEVVDVVLVVEGGDVGSPQRSVALMA